MKELLQRTILIIEIWFCQDAPAAEDDDDLDLFGDETEDEKKAAEEREAAKKPAKKKESKLPFWLILLICHFIILLGIFLYELDLWRFVTDS